MKKPKSKTPKPQRWLYCLARGFCFAVSKLLFRLQITGADSLPKEGPVLFLCNHQGMMDFLLVFAAIKGRMAQFVATQRQFRNPKLHWLYVRLGVIPKIQFHTDPRCVMNILRVLKNGGAIVLFPTGQTAMWGVPGNMDPSIAHLVKRAGASVCTIGLRGGFFTAPRMGGLRYGRTEARMELTFTPQQLKALSEEEIYRTIAQKLDFDEYAWQKQTGATFKGKNLAQGYDSVLAYCPKCGTMGAWHSAGDAVTCTHCGNTGRVKADMHLHPAGAEDVIFPTLKEWQVWQEELLARQMEREDFLLETPVTCNVFQEEDFSYREAGEGVLRLDAREIRYEGTLDGQTVCRAIRHEHLPGLSAEPGVYVELFLEGCGLVRYVPREKAMVTCMKIAQEYLYRKTLA